MTSPFVRMPFRIARNDLPVVSLAGAKPVFGQALEEDADGHWLFGPDAQSLVDNYHVAALSLQGTAPTYGATSITTASGAGNALLTPWEDSLEQTLCLVVKRITTANAIYGGALRNGDATGSSLHVLSSSSAQLRSNVGGSILTQNWPAEIAAGDYGFIALSESLSSEDTEARYAIQYIGGNDPVTTLVPGGRPVSSGSGRIAVGNAYYASGSFASPINAAAACYFPHPKSADELVALYARAIDLMAERAVVVK
ncbi:hypothetical protein ACVFYP_22205 [Roseomonas sp. F4]